MHLLHCDRLDKTKADAIRARGEFLNKEMTKKNAVLKNGKKNVTMT